MRHPHYRRCSELRQGFTEKRTEVERFECLRVPLLTISMGTPQLDAYVAACLLRSCGLNSIPATLPALLTIILAAAHVIGKILWSG
jgi:hypothetical protein